MFDDLDLISAYTRADAIRDGVLVDISEMAKEAGFRFPVAMTAAVYDACATVANGATGQDERGRVWDILSVLRVRVRGARWEESSIVFSVLLQTSDTEPKLVELKAVCGPDDDLAPCITVMFPNED